MCKQAVPTLALALGLLGLACTQTEPVATPDASQQDSTPLNAAQPKETDNALRVALRKSLTDYFIYRGRPRGFEYDLVLRFAKHLDRRLSVQIVSDDEQLEALIRRGEIDLWVPAEPWHGDPFELNPEKMSTWGHEIVGPILGPSVKTPEELL